MLKSKCIIHFDTRNSRLHYLVVFSCNHNKYTLQYLLSLAKVKAEQSHDDVDNESEEAMESCDASDSDDDVAAMMHDFDSASSQADD